MSLFKRMSPAYDWKSAFCWLRPLDGNHTTVTILCCTDPLTLKCQFVLHFCLNLDLKCPPELWPVNMRGWLIPADLKGVKEWLICHVLILILLDHKSVYMLCITWLASPWIIKLVIVSMKTMTKYIDSTKMYLKSQKTLPKSLIFIDKKRRDKIKERLFTIFSLHTPTIFPVILHGSSATWSHWQQTGPMHFKPYGCRRSNNILWRNENMKAT